MKNIILTLMICISLVSIQSCRDTKKETTTEVEKDYEQKDLASIDAFACPMGCEEGKTYESETQCPVCNMVLKKVEDTKSIEDQHQHHENERPEHDTDSVHGEH